MSVDESYKAQPIWSELGPGFSDSVEGASFPKHILRYRNQKWAGKVGLSGLTDQEWIEHFSEFKPLPENLEKPQALRYHGHQFTHYNPDLGDGRGFLFAQVQYKDKTLDLGTKGSGQTPYSRQGDGRLTLKGAVREALATSALEGFGVNTSKTFSVVETGEELVRGDEPSPTRSAVLFRLSHSHIRIGSFQRLAHFKEKDKMQTLIDYCLKHYYPEVGREEFFQAVCARIASTTAQWMVHGFVHGVLNTDNINITGESFDYGPYRFLPHYDTSFTAAYFDHQGLYAYGRQPVMVLWNLERLAESLTLINDKEETYNKGYEKYKEVLNETIYNEFARKIGIKVPENIQKIKNLFHLCLQFLEKSKCPYQAFFHHLYCWHQDLNRPLKEYSPEFYDSPWIEDIEKELGLMERSPQAKEKSIDDYQTLVIDEIESIWSEIDTKDNWQPFYKKIDQLEKA